MPSFSNPVWETIFWWATICALVFGGIGVVCAFVSAWVGYQIADTVQRAADEKISEANKKIADAQVTAATANERASALEVETAKARLETEELRRKMAWRRITRDQHDTIVAALRGHKITIWTSFVGKDPGLYTIP